MNEVDVLVKSKSKSYSVKKTKQCEVTHLFSYNIYLLNIYRTQQEGMTTQKRET